MAMMEWDQNFWRAFFALVSERFYQKVRSKTGLQPYYQQSHSIHPGWRGHISHFLGNHNSCLCLHPMVTAIISAEGPLSTICGYQVLRNYNSYRNVLLSDDFYSSCCMISFNHSFDNNNTHLIFTSQDSLHSIYMQYEKF